MTPRDSASENWQVVATGGGKGNLLQGFKTGPGYLLKHPRGREKMPGSTWKLMGESG